MRKALSLLGIMNDSDLDWLIAAGSRREVAAGDVLIREGQPVDAIFIIVDGLLAVRTTRTGARDVAQLRSGEIVGEMSFVDARPPSASVVSLGPSLVLAIPRGTLAAKLQDDVPFAARFYRSVAVFLSDRLRTTSRGLGYGDKAPEQPEPDEEMDPATLDALALAGARFDWLQRRVKSR
ncbi:MAG: cyclic nucleotide-binding domain-containing protein [Acidobacteriota bacterium]